MRIFFQELKNRRVFRVAIGYAIVASGVVQIIGTVLPIFHIQDWVQQVSVVLVALGFPVALMLAWFFDLTSGGVVLTPNPTGERAANRRRIILLAAMGLFIGGVAVAGYLLWHPWRRAREDSAATLTTAIPEKSIAVLPFANLSDERQNTFFTDGVQDEILNDLAKIADLKVISRTSVMQYKSGTTRNMREIGRQLGVAHVLEGSVQRAGNRVRVTAQLIDARTDATKWSEQYNRDLADVFAIQSEIAEAIVAQLRGQLSSQEKANIEAQPTRDLAAFELYRQAKDIVDSYTDMVDPGAALRQAVNLLDGAAARDPSFVLAYCYATRARDLLYFFDLDLSSAQCDAARTAIETASKLAPDSPEVRLAMADHLFRCQRDYPAARKQLELARPGLPNSVPFLVLSGYLDRRQNRWADAEAEFAKAVKLDPRNPNAVNLRTDTYVLIRDFAKAAQTRDEVIAAGLDIPVVHARRASLEFGATGDAAAFRAALEKLPPDLDVGGGETPMRLMIALSEHDYDGARKILAASRRADFQEIDFSFYYPRPWYEAVIARAQGDQPRARAAFAQVREILEARLKQKPEDARTLAVLAQVDAGLGRKEEALREAKHAVELMPTSRDAYDAPLVLQGLAQVYTWTGDKDHAIETVKKLLSVPSYITPAYLRVDRLWDPLRGDPRFEALAKKTKS